jgi:hypothetical protein
MRPTERPLTFEQEYPKHAFAPLVDFGIALAAWVVRRRAGRRVEPANPSFPPTGAMAQSRQAAIAVTVTLLMAAAYTHVRADTPARVNADPILAVALSYGSDGLDTYAQDMHRFGRSASNVTESLGFCAGPRGADSSRVAGPAGPASAPATSGPAVRRAIESPTARALSQTARLEGRDGLDTYDEDFRSTTRPLLSFSTQ